jgi:hypothetical protein
MSVLQRKDGIQSTELQISLGVMGRAVSVGSIEDGGRGAHGPWCLDDGRGCGITYQYCRANREIQ